MSEFDKIFGKKIKADNAKLGKETASLKQRIEAIESDAAAIEKFWGQSIKLTFPGLLGDYAKMVKATDGLTQVKPSCSKALGSAEKAASEAAMKAAAKAIETHAAEVAKANKTDAKAKKFQKDMLAFAKKLKDAC